MAKKKNTPEVTEPEVVQEVTEPEVPQEVAEPDVSEAETNIPEAEGEIGESKEGTVKAKFIKDLPHQFICGKYYSYEAGESAALPTTVYNILKTDGIVA